VPIDLRTGLRVLQRNFVLIAVSVFVAAAVGYVKAPEVSTLYSASELAVVALKGHIVASELLATAEASEETISLVAASPATAAIAVAATGVDRSPLLVSYATRAVPLIATLFIKITVVDPDPNVAARLADAMPAALDREVADVASGSLDGVDPLDIRPFGVAVVTRPTEGLRRVSNAGLGAVLGFLIASFAVLLVRYVDLTVTGPALAEMALDLPVLGTTVGPGTRPEIVKAGRRVRRAGRGSSPGRAGPAADTRAGTSEDLSPPPEASRPPERR